MRRTSLFALLAAALTAVLLLSGCAEKKTAHQKRPSYSSDELQFTTPQDGDPIAIFKTSMGEIRAVLYPDVAPMAVENFEGLAQQGYYDGLTFHRVVYNFVIQSGDKTGTGLSGSTIWHNNPYPVERSDKLHHYSGALCMAHSSDDESTCLSQYYFVQSSPTLSKDLKSALESSGFRQEVIDAYKAVGGLPYLDNQYTVFGQVYRGMETVDAIGAADTDKDGKPTEDITVDSVTIGSYSAEEEQSLDEAVSSSASSK